MARIGILLSLALVLVGACADPSRAPGAGCVDTVADRLNVDAPVVTLVRARGCRDVSGSQLLMEQAVDRVSETVWTSVRQPLDAQHLHVAGSDDGATAPVVVPRAESDGRFGTDLGPGVRSEPRRGGQEIWLLLPFAWLVAAVVVFRLVRRLARAGIVVIFLRG